SLQIFNYFQPISFCVTSERIFERSTGRFEWKLINAKSSSSVFGAFVSRNVHKANVCRLQPMILPRHRN
uniref:Ovule protein n=1 Tax=Parascaris univalens TaxID=6257 RepID=A0A915ACL4_PARUN